MFFFYLVTSSKYDLYNNYSNYFNFEISVGPLFMENTPKIINK